MCGTPYNICLLTWVANLETSHVLQGNKNKTYRGRCDRLSVSIGSVPDNVKIFSQKLRDQSLENIGPKIHKQLGTLIRTNVHQNRPFIQ